MSRTRLLAAAALTAAAFPSAADARTIEATIPLKCGATDTAPVTQYWLSLRATVADTTAPGESIRVTAISG